jgi:hypothetical protein
MLVVPMVVESLNQNGYAHFRRSSALFSAGDDTRLNMRRDTSVKRFTSEIAGRIILVSKGETGLISKNEKTGGSRRTGVSYGAQE